MGQSEAIVLGIVQAYMTRTKLPRKLKKAFKKIHLEKAIRHTKEKTEVTDMVIKFGIGKASHKARRLFVYSFHGLVSQLREKIALNKSTSVVE